MFELDRNTTKLWWQQQHVHANEASLMNNAAKESVKQSSDSWARVRGVCVHGVGRDKEGKKVYVVRTTFA